MSIAPRASSTRSFSESDMEVIESSDFVPTLPAPLVQSYSYDYLTKIIVIGDERVGKSCLIGRWQEDIFPSPKCPYHTGAQAIDFKVKSNISVADRDLDGLVTSPPVMKKVKTQMWEMGGLERFHMITSAYYNGATVVLFVFDLTNRESFEHIKDWNTRFHYELDGKTERRLSPSLIKVLVGTKCLQDNHAVSYSEAEALATQLNMVYWTIDSSSGFHVTDMFMDAIERQISKAKRVSLTQNLRSRAPHPRYPNTKAWSEEKWAEIKESRREGHADKKVQRTWKEWINSWFGR
jgi:GTPase SAR1 family protein